MDRSIDQILADYRKTFAAVQDERRRMSEIRESAAFKDLQEQIDKLHEEQDALFAGIPNSIEEHTADTLELIHWMKENGVTTAGEFRAKVHQKKRVDTSKLMNYGCEGDLDMFNTIVVCTQKAVTDFCKGISDPIMKKRLKECIVDEGQLIIGIEPIESSDSSPTE